MRTKKEKNKFIFFLSFFIQVEQERTHCSVVSFIIKNIFLFSFEENLFEELEMLQHQLKNQSSKMKSGTETSKERPTI